MSDQHYDTLVIGSGFGGAVNALRLAEAGRSDLVLERGQRYGLGMFPRDVADSDRVFWRYPFYPRSQGLHDIGVFSVIAVVAASGVGGGSLTYANIHVRPDPAVFDDPAWPAELNRASLEPYYDMVAQKLKVAPIPREIRLSKRDACQKITQDLNVEAFEPDQAVAWVDAPRGISQGLPAVFPVRTRLSVRFQAYPGLQLPGAAPAAWRCGTAPTSRRSSPTTRATRCIATI